MLGTLPRNRQGFALVLVLIVLVLALAISVFFITAAGRERRGVDLYSRGSQAEHLAGMAVNQVMGLIGEATGENTAAAPVSWASQPGMIRTYGDNGAARNVYKLYSWDRQKQAGAGFDPAAADQLPSASWSTDTAHYTDLNQPINDVYPIMDPRAEGVVEGFSVDEGSQIVSGSPSPGAMPVKWLYVLKDGRLVAPGGGSGATATIPGADAGNPPIGRVAYWTDDETSKVNLNTASEGAFWDRSVSGSRDDLQFAGNPPTKGEFQRIPGHPAMTSLSAVFPEFLEQNADPTQTRWTNSNYRPQIQAAFDFTPRIAYGGSQGGTLPITSYDFNYEPARDAVVPPASITPDTERLFASVDDAWFRPDRASAPVLVGGLHNAQAYKRRLFFLTESSTAPETTLFETPRVSLWPVTWPWKSSYFTERKVAAPAVLAPDSTPLASNPWMTPEEKLLAFCSTLNASAPGESARLRYYFQRQNPDSPTHDWENIRRNRELQAYIARLLEKRVPGWGASLGGKWGAGMSDFMALNTLNFVRSFVNQYTMGDTRAGRVDALQYSYTGVAFRGAQVGTGSGIIVESNAYTAAPLRTEINGADYETSGAFPTLEEAALMFYATSRREPEAPALPADRGNPFKWKNLINPGGNYTTAPFGSSTYDNATPGDTSDDTGSRTTGMRAVMFLDWVGLTQGVIKSNQTFWVKVTGPSFLVNGNAINFPSESGRVFRYENQKQLEGQWVGALFVQDSASSAFNYNFAKTFEPTATGYKAYPLVSDPIPADPNALEFLFEGRELKVEIFAPYSDLQQNPTGDPKQLIAERTIDFGKWTGSKLPIPLAPRWTTYDGIPMIEGTTYNKPDPNFGGGTDAKWCMSEFVPVVEQLDKDIKQDPRDRVITSTASTALSTQVYNNRITVYTYKGRKDGDPLLLSPNLENRVLAFGYRSTGGKPVYAVEGAASTTNPYLYSTELGVQEASGLVSPYDTVISMIADPDGARAGDIRVNRGVEFVRSDSLGLGSPALVIQSRPRGQVNQSYYPRSTAGAQWHALSGERFPFQTGYRVYPKGPGGSGMTARYGYYSTGVGKLGEGDNYAGYVGADFDARGTFPTGDYTGNPGNLRDGAYLGRPDQEYQLLANDASDTTRMWVPFFNRIGYGNYGAKSSNYFSPNRQVPGPVILGTLASSLTTGWQTLLFAPNPRIGASHPGLDTPPDHLYLDYFWMPVCEPYPISDQFSTAGKVNLNYALAPFPHIQRKTALHAALKATWLTALADGDAEIYKSHQKMRDKGARTRFAIDVEETLKDFDVKFAAGDLFRSASQVCEMFLVPEGESLASTKSTFWPNKAFTADNFREGPYNHIYSRLTTKSNTFTVHWRVQALQKSRLTPAGTWDDKRDRVAAELRGSSLIERYIDPNATDIPDYATDPNAEPLTRFYKWRVASETHFQP
jgi:hypothetical protein